MIFKNKESIDTIEMEGDSVRNNTSKKEYFVIKIEIYVLLQWVNKPKIHSNSPHSSFRAKVKKHNQFLDSNLLGILSTFKIWLKEKKYSTEFNQSIILRAFQYFQRYKSEVNQQTCYDFNC